MYKPQTIKWLDKFNSSDYLFNDILLSDTLDEVT